LFSNADCRNGGNRDLSLELNTGFAAAADILVELTGLRDFVRIIVGRSDVVPTQIHYVGRCEERRTSLRSLQTSIYYLGTDVKLCEHLGAIAPSVFLTTDNIVVLRAEQKREAAEGWTFPSIYNTTGMAERTVQSFAGKSDVPTFDFLENNTRDCK
jgi:catechol O-methyltransferase